PIYEPGGALPLRFRRPGNYTISSRLQGFNKAEQKNIRVPQRGDVTVDLVLTVGGVAETVTVAAPPVMVQVNTGTSNMPLDAQAPPVMVQSNTGPSNLTLERQLLDQVPISGRNPYNPANLDPTVFNTPNST